MEAIRTEDDSNDGVRQGVSASVERALNRIMSLELGVRYYQETVNAVPVPPASKSRLTMAPPFAPS